MSSCIPVPAGSGVKTEDGMSDAAFQATYSDIKMIKGRKVAQVILEVPLEQADHAMRVLGGFPNPGAETWVAVARLVKEADKPKEKTEGEKAVARAALLCKEPSFIAWIEMDTPDDIPRGADPMAFAAQQVRWRCNVASRSELATNPEALARFKKLDAEYKDWLRYGDRQ